ncbi:MAG: (R)-2-hydroxyglutaryl-CoA dehydratase subunit beta [Gemmiger sp.]
MSIDRCLDTFGKAARAPKEQLAHHKRQGKKVIGILPYYAPEELVYAAGMVPMGIWGSNTKTINRAREYCATFYCTIAQLAMEMLLDGTLDQLDGIITPTICDTLRPMSQNFRVAMADKLPVIFLAHPQNRFADFGLRFCVQQYTNVKKQLEAISGAPITDEALREAIRVCNKSRAARRRFVRLAAQHADRITPVSRSAVLKAAWFMDKAEYTVLLEELNNELEALPVCHWDGPRVVTSGIICDNPRLLAAFEENHIAIVADDVAHESRSFRTDVPAEEPDPLLALARQFAAQDYDILLYDPASAQNRRGEFVANLVKSSGAQGLVLFMQQFCDPEEMEYPYLKKALNDAGIPHIKIGIDQQMRDFGQARTALQAFADVLAMT